MSAFLRWIACGLVQEEEVGGVGSAMGNPIIRHFFAELSLFNMSLLDDTVDPCQWSAILCMQGSSLCTAQLSKELFCMGEVSGLLPILRAPNCWVRCTVRRGGGCVHLKKLVLVVIRSEAKQA